MKVLQILPSLEVGGVERGVIDLVRALKQLGERSVVISSGGKLVAELQKMGIPHYTLPVHRKSLMSLALIPKIMDILVKERVDIVHARSRVPAWLAWFAARRVGIPFVTTCHGYYSNHFLSRIMGWGKIVIVISRIIGRHMIDDFNVSPERIRLVHRGIDLPEFSFQPMREHGKSDEFRIINVGRLSPIKGQLEFLKAIHLLRSKLHRVEVLLVGSEVKGKTKYTRKIQETIHQLGLDTCVKLLGTRGDIAALIRDSDLLVLSTLVPEAFGRVIVEAGAVGTPVLATKVGGVLDIIDHGENGLLVPPRNPEAMAESMYKILTNRELSESFATRLRKKVEESFTLDMMVEKTMEIYRDIERQKKIMIIKLGAMGDLILGTPSFRMIRKRFPEAWISVLVDKKLASMISYCPYLNEVIPIQRKKLSKLTYLLKLAKRLRREGFDLSVDLQNAKWTHLMAALAGIPQRYGFRRGRFGFLINRHDRSFDLADSPVKHQFRILSKLGIQSLDEDLELWPDIDSDHRIERLLKQGGKNGNSRLVGLAIGSSPKWPTKRWPLEYYRELGQIVAKNRGCRVVLIGTEDDTPQAQALMKEGGDQFVDFVGKTSLQDLVSLVKRLDVLVTGDTAPLHIAAAVKTKFIAIFGPTDPKRHAPPGNSSIIMTRYLSCQPCYKGQCTEKENLACLRRISVDEVFEAVSKHLES